MEILSVVFMFILLSTSSTSPLDFIDVDLIYKLSDFASKILILKVSDNLKPKFCLPFIH
jgi:hypothetical protein